MTNKEISHLLRNVAVAYLLKDENKYRFQIIAYQKAADAIDLSPREVKDLWKEGKLLTINAIGPKIAEYLEELLVKGKVSHFEKLMKDIPKTLFELLSVPGIGPKKAYKLVKILKINKEGTAIEKVKNAAEKNKISKIEGFGEKSQSDILINIQSFKKGQIKENRMVLPFAYEISKDIISYLKIIPEVIVAESLGSLRRMASTIGDIDIAVSTLNNNKVIEHFCNYPKKERLLEKGETTASFILTNGKQVDLMVQSPKSFGALLQHFTGSKQHNIALREYALKQKMSLSEYGIKINNNSLVSPKSLLNKQNYNSKTKIYEFENEKDFYNALKLQWIPPELREDKGEIEASAKNKLPNLVSIKDIKGDLHLHSNYNLEPSHDLGQNSMQEMLEKAENLNYQYIAVSEHSPSVGNHTKKEIIDILKRRKDYIEQINYSHEKNKKNTVKKIFNSMEVDILINGEISIPNEGIDQLDYYIVSIHSGFNMQKEEITKRILHGLENEKAKILGHPTGRLLGKREGYEADWLKIFNYCAKNNKAIEISAYPDRLDLPDYLVKEAINNNVKLVINTDSHDVNQMNMMFYGVSVGRRGWAKVSDIINTLSYNNFIEWIKK